MSTAPPGLPAPKPAGKGLGAWFTGHKTQAYIGAAGLVITIALYVKSKDSAAAASSGTTDSTAVPTSTADTTGTDAYNGIEDQVLGLQSALLALQNPQTGSSVPSTVSEGQQPGITTTPSVSTAPALQPNASQLDALGLSQGQNDVQAQNNANAEVAYQGATGQTSALEQMTVAGTSGQSSPGGLPTSFWEANGGVPS